LYSNYDEVYVDIFVGIDQNRLHENKVEIEAKK